MGKTKTKFIDDSAPAEEVKKATPKKVVKDELVEKLKAELGIEETAKPSVTPEVSKTEKVKQKVAKAKPGSKPQAKSRSKKYQEAAKDLDKTKTYSLNEAVEIVKRVSYTNFDGTLETHINTANTNIRGLVSLPYFSGRKLRILAFGPTANTSKVGSLVPGGLVVSNVEPVEGDSLEVSEGVTLGSDETIEQISKGKIGFDLIITTPEWMPKLARVAKFLGPKGLMPNPKNGTITDDLKKAVDGFQAGKTEYITESKAPVIHIGLGKISQPTDELVANIKVLLQTIGKTRVKKVSLSPTMGPSVKVDLASI